MKARQKAHQRSRSFWPILSFIQWPADQHATTGIHHKELRVPVETAEYDITIPAIQWTQIGKGYCLNMRFRCIQQLNAPLAEPLVLEKLGRSAQTPECEQLRVAA